MESRTLSAAAQVSGPGRRLTQRGVVAIPKSVRAERMAENLDIFNVDLCADEVNAIAALDTKMSSFLTIATPQW